MKRSQLVHLGLGASEAPSIAGLSPFRTPVEVWMEKVGLTRPRPSSPAQTVGLTLEGAVIDLGAAQTLERITRNAQSFPHADWPEVPMFATPDGFTKGRYGTVEVKVVGHRWADWTAGVPAYVETQCQAHLACYPKARFALVIALLGTDVRTWYLDRDPAMVAALEADAVAWWTSYVVPEIAPPPVDDDDRWSVARYLAGRSLPHSARPASESEAALGARLSALLDQADDLAAQTAGLRLALAESSVDIDLDGGGWRGTWSTRRTTDWAAVAKEAAAPAYLVEAHTESRPTFTFRRRRTEEPAA